VPRPLCPICGKPQPTAAGGRPVCRDFHNPALRLSRAAALHTHPLREAIHALKYEDQPELAVPLARYLVAVFAADPWPALASSLDAVVPVPLHAQRLAERGYNQSERLAAAFCSQTGMQLAPEWLARTRQTRQQVGLGPVERRANVVDAFSAAPTVAGKTILLIDDVLTTGATLAACATAAQAAGAVAVYALTLAIPLHGDGPP
jgi:ComF family protein